MTEPAAKVTVHHIRVDPNGNLSTHDEEWPAEKSPGGLAVTEGPTGWTVYGENRDAVAAEAATIRLRAVGDAGR